MIASPFTLDPNELNVFAAVVFASSPGVFRIVRGLTLDIKTRDYVAAAQTRGERPWYIMLWEILPNARGPLIVDFCLRIGYTTILLGTLGFFGLGLLFLGLSGCFFGGLLFGLLRGLAFGFLCNLALFLFLLQARGFDRFVLRALRGLALRAGFLENAARFLAIAVIGANLFLHDLTLDVGAFLADFYRNRSCFGSSTGCTPASRSTPRRNRRTQFGLCFSFQRYLTATAGRERAPFAMALPQKIQQLDFLVIGDGRILVINREPRLTELHQQPVGRNTNHFCELFYCYI